MLLYWESEAGSVKTLLPRPPVWAESSEAPASPELSEDRKKKNNSSDDRVWRICLKIETKVMTTVMSQMILLDHLESNKTFSCPVVSDQCFSWGSDWSEDKAHENVSFKDPEDQTETAPHPVFSQRHEPITHATLSWIIANNHLQMCKRQCLITPKFTQRAVMLNCSTWQLANSVTGYHLCVKIKKCWSC